MSKITTYSWTKQYEHNICVHYVQYVIAFSRLYSWLCVRKKNEPYPNCSGTDSWRSSHTEVRFNSGENVFRFLHRIMHRITHLRFFHTFLVQKINTTILLGLHLMILLLIVALYNDIHCCCTCSPIVSSKCKVTFTYMTTTLVASWTTHALGMQCSKVLFMHFAIKFPRLESFGN